MAGDQFLDEYKSISPNSKIPALIDPNGPGGRPITLMESGAILLYLAEKTGKLLPLGEEKFSYLPWLFFQVGHIGPMFGQFGHFYRYAKDKCDHPYPIERYRTEVKRLLQVLETRLKASPYVGGPLFSIVDIAHYPWVECLDQFYNAAETLELDRYVNVKDWLDRCRARPSYARGSKVCA